MSPIISVKCPQCSAATFYRTEHLGERAICSTCGHTFEAKGAREANTPAKPGREPERSAPARKKPKPAEAPAIKPARQPQPVKRPPAQSPPVAKPPAAQTSEPPLPEPVNDRQVDWCYCQPDNVEIGPVSYDNLVHLLVSRQLDFSRTRVRRVDEQSLQLASECPSFRGLGLAVRQATSPPSPPAGSEPITTTRSGWLLAGVTALLLVGVILVLAAPQFEQPLPEFVRFPAALNLSAFDLEAVGLPQLDSLTVGYLAVLGGLAGISFLAWIAGVWLALPLDQRPCRVWMVLVAMIPVWNLVLAYWIFIGTPLALRRVANQRGNGQARNVAYLSLAVSLMMLLSTAATLSTTFPFALLIGVCLLPFWVLLTNFCRAAIVRPREA